MTMAEFPRSNQFSILANIPWGKPNGIEPFFEGGSSGGKASKVFSDKVFTRPQVRTDNKGCFYVLNTSVASVREQISIYLIKDSQIKSKVKLPLFDKEHEQRIVDFVANEDNIIFLETYTKNNVRYNRLTALDLNGNIQWSLSGEHKVNHLNEPSTLVGTFHKIIALNKKIALVSNQLIKGRSGDNLSSLTLINSESGAFLAPASFEQFEQLQVFGNQKNDFVRTVFLSNKNCYGMVLNKNDEVADRVMSGGTEVYGPLQSAFAIDDDLNLYVNHQSIQHKISSRCEISFSDYLVDLNYDSVNDVLYVLRCHNQKLGITQITKKKVSAECHLQIDEELEQFDEYRIVKVDNKSFHIYLKKHSESLEKVFVFSPLGQLIEQYEYKHEFQAPLGALSFYSDWQVAGAGKILLPLTTEKGLIIVQWKWVAI